MVEHGVESSAVSEERTEPISQSEMDARIKSMRMHEPEFPLDDRMVPLDVLQLEEHHHRQNIRLLVRPLTKLHNTRSVSPDGSDNCQWLALRAEVASADQPEYKVLAVTQTSKDIKFSVRIPGESQHEFPRPPLWCELYYDPASDKVVFLNKSDVPISLLVASHTPLASPPAEATRVINPGLAKALKPGTWRIKVHDIAVLDFRILEKRPVTIYQPFPVQNEELSSGTPRSHQTGSSIKRSLTPDDDEKRVKRRTSDAVSDLDDGAVMFLRPGGDASDSLVFPLPNARDTREVTLSNGQPLLDASKGETVAVSGVCELDEYQLTKQEPIASTVLSAVYTANHSRVPEDIVTVKVLKTRVANPGDKPLVHERNVIRQADMWLRECQSQEDLQHRSIVKYYGGDARFLSLYMEHVDAQDLTAVPRWRDQVSDEFHGSRADAVRILRDIGEALSYLHGRDLVHNDIKPANILYSPDRGAVLCDFGLSTPAAKAPSGGGTPYYVPPEFIGRKLRGPASDVWALGVTMLYVMRKIPFPDGRARRRHARPLYWQIAGINNPNIPYRQYGNGQPAANQMRDWLVEMFEARDKLNSHDRLERVVKEMLTPNPQHRITMARVVQELNGGQIQSVG
ncbi:Serine/threonine-protein kinase-like protein [Hapsidospora chrysogenum ATCC 11550]|uniref:Serine/threonine-protein kinase-like protein n=1 Tax=Hapsidospora chrysogenum (strain ATCC 11550 / CBS 779.69 / DSM 880 / IAM 14645 / JCM 23072 / IMI 49137) TaxID=857340 RepID=A0A086T1Y5_HAPC1|nr:Serine/threonine-protein kinase-like protein [Hapsidospora chrysogenum ATCC 11550]